MRSLIAILTLFLFHSFMLPISADGIYKWTDRYGKTQYGDKPPKGVKANPVSMPAITVLEDYGQQWKSGQNTQQPETQEEPASSSSRYSSLTILAPKGDQAIRANDGDVSVMLSMKPKLKKGHSIVMFLDGRKVSNGSSRAINLPNLKRGLHSIKAEIRDAHSNALVRSDTVSFTVLRNSVLTNKKLNKNQPSYNLGYDSANGQSPWIQKK